MQKRLIALTILVGLLFICDQAHALGISQRDGEGNFSQQNARLLVLPSAFMNFFYDKTQKVASLISYADIKMIQIDETIRSSFEKRGFKLVDEETLKNEFRLEDKSNAAALRQLYQDFAQVLKDSVSVMWPLLNKVEDYRLGRQSGNTLTRLPTDLTHTYFVTPMGLEFENERREVFGFLGVAIVDKDAEIVTAAAVRYAVVGYTQKGLEKDFRKLAERCAKKLSSTS